MNNTMKKLDLTGIHRIFHPTIAGYTFRSGVHGTLSRIDHVRS